MGRIDWQLKGLRLRGFTGLVDNNGELQSEVSWRSGNQFTAQRAEGEADRGSLSHMAWVQSSCYADLSTISRPFTPSIFCGELTLRPAFTDTENSRNIYGAKVHWGKG